MGGIRGRFKSCYINGSEEGEGKEKKVNILQHLVAVKKNIPYHKRHLPL